MLHILIQKLNFDCCNHTQARLKLLNFDIITLIAFEFEKKNVNPLFYSSSHKMNRFFPFQNSGTLVLIGRS